MILIIDNYDSFTFNIVQAVGALGEESLVFRNDAVTPKKIEKSGCARIIVSPGPKTPREAGVSMKVIKAFAGKIPILGICLGHQCIAAAFGGKIVRAGRLMHGKTSLIHHDGKTIFKGLPNPFDAMRYHSLIVDAESLPAEFETSASSDEGELMAIRHKEFPLEGVQFHPESYKTGPGLQLLENFLKGRGEGGGQLLTLDIPPVAHLSSHSVDRL